MTAQLIIRTGTLAGTRFFLEKGVQAVLGRDEHADLVLKVEGVSRRHCVVVHKGDRLLVTDLESHNGTWVNEQRVTSRHVDHGDRLTLGIATIDVEILEQPENDCEHRTTISLIFDDDDQSAVTRAVPDLIAGDSGVFSTEDPGDDDTPAWTRGTLRDLCQIGHVLNSEHDLAALFDTIADCVMRILEPDRVAILLYDSSSGSIEPVVARGHQGGSEDRFEVSRTVVREVLERGVAAMSADAMSDERFERGESIVEQTIRSVVCVPLRSKHGLLGALYADTTDPARRFGGVDLDVMAVVGAQAGVAVERMKLLERLESLFLGAIRALVTSIEVRDPYTRGHSERVTAYSLALAHMLGLPQSEREVLELAALLHDVGKIGVPEAILNKPGSLGEDEYRVLQEHSVHGEEIVRHVRHEHISQVVLAVRHHHERWDGQGYPDGLSGSLLTPAARILAVADAWDAMTSDRPYRRAFDHAKALGILEEQAGAQFDPEIVEAFLTAYRSGMVEQAGRLEGAAAMGRFLFGRAASIVRRPSGERPA